MSEDGYAAVVVDPISKRAEKKQEQLKRQPRYNVVLWDDDDHSYEYVVLMMRQLFQHAYSRGYEIARMVDDVGRAICLTTTMEHAELKMEQIHAFGKDSLIPRCQGSMSASIEAISND